MMGNGAKIQNVYPLTPMQQGMLFHYLYHKDSRAYFQQLSFSIEAEINIELFEKSLNQIMERYDAFRTIFIYEKVEEPKQVVLTERTVKVFYEDISHLELKDRIRYLDDFMEKDREKGFDLSKDILTRIAMIRLGEKDYQIIWSHHHMIMDGWCLGLVLTDFINTYRALNSGTAQKAPKVYQYVDYINWLVKQDKSEATRYWKEYLEDYDNEISFKQKRKTKVYDYEKKELHFSVDQEITSKMVDLCRKYNVTLNNAFQAIWAILLQKYNNTKDVVFGAVVSGRNAPINGIEQMVGLFINTIPIRVQSENDLSFKDLLEQVRDNYNRSIKYDFMSLAEIQKTSGLKQNLISSLFIFENYPARDVLDKGDHYKIKEVQSFEQTNYDFNIIMIPSEEIQLKFKYNSLVYEDKTVETIKNHLLQLIHCISNNFEICLKDINMLTDDEKDELVARFNQSSMDYNRNATLHELFETQAVTNPNTIAVAYKNLGITYNELNEKANSIAWILRDMGVTRDTIVALVTERSIDMIIGILAILKAGGAYLPIDPKYPNERITYMLSDSKAMLIVTNMDLKEVSFPGKIVDLRDYSNFEISSSNPININQAKDLAYIIYTSGTTGNPKGVMLEHKSVNNLCANIYHHVYRQYEGKLKIALLSPYVFDASVKQIFPALLFGHTLVIVPEEERFNGEKLAAYYLEHSIDLSDGTPAHLSILKDILIEKNLKLPTKQFLIGGEELSPILVRQFLQSYDNKSLKITNVYGPTECCDVSTIYHIDNENLEQLSKIPIGKNLENVQIYVLDPWLNPTPFDTPGEIYISGDGLSRGYLNQSELTKDRFINNPFIEGTKMYRTGDQGIRLKNGDIEYLGRVDHQVKIRGFRIETGEIEKQILSYSGIKEVAVICGEDRQGSKYLAAFLVTEGSLIVYDLKEYLAKKLPDYMIPAYIVEIDKIPVTHNGKINRNKLVELLKVEQLPYTAPRNELERELITIWQDILVVERIGIQDDFFAIGGDSLKAIRILSKANSLKIPISVKSILEYRTVERIMDNYYSNTDLEVKSEAAVSLQDNPYDFEKERLHNKDFKVTEEYPSYYGCMAGVVLEKLKHEKNIHLERSFMTVGGGKFYITYGHVNDMTLQNKLQFRELPKEMNPAVINIYDEMGVKEKVISSTDLETALSYCKEHLQRNELIMVSGTTYYLNYTPDYCIGEDKWRKRLDVRPENRIAVSNKSSGRAHTFLLIDILKDGYLVYDTTFNYYGVVPKEDFNRAFAGLRGMRFLDGTYAQTNNLPYVITELDFSDLKELSNKQLAIEILKNNLDINLSNQRIDFEANGHEFTFYTGVRAYKEIAGMLKEFQNNEKHREDLIRLLQSSFGSLKYKFIFFQEFLEDLLKYIELPKEYIDYCKSFIEDCTEIGAQAEKIDIDHMDNFIIDMSGRLDNIYEQQFSFLSNLKSLILCV